MNIHLNLNLNLNLNLSHFLVHSSWIGNRFLASEEIKAVATQCCDRTLGIERGNAKVRQ